MSDGWTTYPGAPEVGTVLCAATVLPQSGAIGITVGGFPVLLLRHSATVRAYVNACPHQYLPLDHRSSNLLSADGAVIRCSNHQAGFDAASGAGVEGIGIGQCLDPIPVIEQDGQIVIAAAD